MIIDIGNNIYYYYDSNINSTCNAGVIPKQFEEYGILASDISINSIE